jgi:putative salt-induced outer membrane protein YdiY
MKGHCPHFFMISRLILLWLCLGLGFLPAQVNTEKYRSDGKLEGWSFALELNGTAKTGNTENQELSIQGRIDHRTATSLTFLILENEYEWVDGGRLVNEQLVHLRHSFAIDTTTKIEFFGQVNFDKNLLINDRELIGAGVRMRLLQSKKASLFYGTSYMFEHENYDLPKTAIHPSVVDVQRWSNYIAAAVAISENTRLSSVLYYQPMFVEFDDYRILNETNLMIGISEHFSVSVDFKLRTDSKPADGIKKTDTNSAFGLVVAF